jgi:hypothetical protein
MSHEDEESRLPPQGGFAFRNAVLRVAGSEGRLDCKRSVREVFRGEFPAPRLLLLGNKRGIECRGHFLELV